MNAAESKYCTPTLDDKPHHKNVRYRVPHRSRQYMVLWVRGVSHNRRGATSCHKPKGFFHFSPSFLNQRRLFTPVAKPKATSQSRQCSSLGWATCVLLFKTHAPGLQCSCRVEEGQESRTLAFPGGCLGLHICASDTKKKRQGHPGHGVTFTAALFSVFAGTVRVDAYNS